MKNFFAIAPWVVWVLWFIAWEINGFRHTHDRWPTLSELVKRWEVQRQQMAYHTLQPKMEQYANPKMVRQRGLTTWTWKRWFVAGGLPLVAIVLELHWVWEII